MDQLILPVLTYDTPTEKYRQGDGVVIVEHEARAIGGHIRCLLTAVGQLAGDCPNVYVERRPDGWNVIVHDGCGDPVFEIEIRGAQWKVLDVAGKVLGEARV